jgi:hypothetical protein
MMAARPEDATSGTELDCAFFDDGYTRRQKFHNSNSSMETNFKYELME